MTNQTQKVIEFDCQVRSTDNLRINQLVDDTIEVSIQCEDSTPNRAVCLNRADVRRLQGYLDAHFPMPKAPVAPASAVHKNIAGLGGKELVFDAGNTLGQTTLTIRDGYTVHHIVLNEQAVAELHTLVSKEVFRFSAKVNPPMPNWNDSPGTMTFALAEGEKLEVSLAQENLTVALGHEADFGWEYVHLNQIETDALIKHLQHCRHHMHGLVRVKEVPDYSGPAPKPTYVVIDMQGEPQCVLHSEAAVAQYLSTNKLRVAQ